MDISRNTMINIFTKHPKEVGETYWEHFRYAVCFAGYLVIGGLCCFIHAIFPFVFKDTATNFLIKIIKRMQKTKRWPSFKQSVFGDG